MTFRSKLFLNFIIALLLAVGLVAAGVTMVTRRVFDELKREHTDAMVAQFQREFERRGQDVAHRVKAIAEEEATTRMAVDLSRPNADVSVYVHDAHGVSGSHQLDFLDFVGNDGAIISSQEYPARFGYKLTWVTQPDDWAARGAFLMKVETDQGPALGLMAVSAVRVGDRDLYVVGGERLGEAFLKSLVLPADMRALLYLNLDPEFQEPNLIDEKGPAPDGDRFQALVEKIEADPVEQTEKISWGFDPSNAEVFHALPLVGRQKELLGVLFVGSSQRTVVSLERRIRWLALGVAAVGLLLGLLLSWWGAARVTRPVQKLSAAAREVSQGNWNARVDVRGNDEIGQLAKSFNQMTTQLVEQRERLVQIERVAAWRELARRLAHELKNPLFPLQTTVENLQRAREQNSAQFDEVFRESTGIMLGEIDNLKAIVSRFSDFAKMPRPQLEIVDLNELVRESLKLFEAQMQAAGVTLRLELAADVRAIQADPSQLGSALQNLALNAIDAMPSGGTLTVRTASQDGGVRLEIADTGQGLTQEECDRLFTPYYTTKTHGTGLGLAIVQSVVSDHGGRIAVRGEPGRGTTFLIDLA